MSLDQILWIGSIVLECSLFGVLAFKRIYRTMPAFFVFVCWNLLSDFLTFLMQHSMPLESKAYFRIYEVSMALDSALIFAVLVELAWSVLKPVRAALPRGAWIGIALLTALAGLLLWPVAGLTMPNNLSPSGSSFFHLQQTTAILRVVIFLAMAGFSQILSIGWRNRELQAATGLGIYSLISLIVTTIHTHQMVGSSYHLLDQLVNLGYLGSLSYWILSFVLKEADRKKISPQMTRFLLLVGGVAKNSRTQVTDFMVTIGRDKEER